MRSGSTFLGRMFAGGKERFGFFGDSSVPVSEAVNHINGLRLQRSLMIAQAKSIFMHSGELPPKVIHNSILIMPGEELDNFLLREELFKNRR